VFLGLNGLAEDGLAAAVLLAHGAGRRFHVAEGFGLHRRGMRDDGLGAGIYLEHRTAAGAGHLVRSDILRHAENNTANISARSKLDRKNLEQVEHLPAQQTHGNNHHQNGQHFAEVQAVTPRVETTGAEGENIDGREPKDQRP
jgi:hypothetical protein